MAFMSHVSWLRRREKYRPSTVPQFAARTNIIGAKAEAWLGVGKRCAKSTQSNLRKVNPTAWGPGPDRRIVFFPLHDMFGASVLVCTVLRGCREIAQINNYFY